MIKDFFLDKFEYDFYSNKLWSNHLLRFDEKVSAFSIKSMSHIINVHHIWITRLTDKKAESGAWDQLPIDFFVKLNQNNYQETVSYLEHCEFNQKINYHDSEGVMLSKEMVDILYHILNHSNYHRAQIVLDLKNNGFPVPNSNFITYK